MSVKKILRGNTAQMKLKLDKNLKENKKIKMKISQFH